MKHKHKWLPTDKTRKNSSLFLKAGIYGTWSRKIRKSIMRKPKTTQIMWVCECGNTKWRK